jgi:hypothetical protein
MSRLAYIFAAVVLVILLPFVWAAAEQAAPSKAGPYPFLEVGASYRFYGAMGWSMASGKATEKPGGNWVKVELHVPPQRGKQAAEPVWINLEYVAMIQRYNPK